MIELQKYITKYFDQRPQFDRPEETVLGFEIPVPWKYVMESMLVDIAGNADEIEECRKLLGVFAACLEDPSGLEFFDDQLHPNLQAMIRQHEKHFDIEWIRSVTTKDQKL